jgi:hypothetical protein
MASSQSSASDRPVSGLYDGWSFSAYSIERKVITRAICAQKFSAICELHLYRVAQAIASFSKGPQRNKLDFFITSTA